MAAAGLTHGARWRLEATTHEQPCRHYLRGRWRKGLVVSIVLFRSLVAAHHRAAVEWPPSINRL